MRRQVAGALEGAPGIPASVLFQPVIKSAEEATALCLRAQRRSGLRGVDHLVPHVFAGENVDWAGAVCVSRLAFQTA